jgi:hypothetical protein
MAAAADSPIIGFYRERGRDHRGRRLAEILHWDDEALESIHDFIQWLFPLDEPSGANRSAPILTPADIAAFRNDPALRHNLRRSLVRMLAFYGLRLVDDEGGAPTVARSGTWPERSSVWLSPHNHNYLRLTRIMKSLALLGMPGHARAVCDALLEAAGLVEPGVTGSTTLRYWKSAGGLSNSNL